MRTVVALLLAATPAAAQVGAPYDRPAGAGRPFPPTNVPPIGFYPWFPVVYPLALYPPAVVVPPPVVAEAVPNGRLLGTHYLSSAAGRAKAVETAARVNVTTRMTVELPAAGEVWVNDMKRPGTATTHVLTADVPPGGSHTFAVVARWTANGKEYEWTKTSALSAGDSTSVIVSAGTQRMKSSK